jgi:serine/threonine protein kinase/tetratricopeptide (TPR) repeat protein
LDIVGRTISHYQVLEALGAGGMGVVYKAEDTRLGRLVALKMLSDELSKDRTALERFQREARAASALNHPNICTIYEVDEADGTPFLVMELLDGQTLRECGRLENEKIIDVAIEFADALASAHEAHIIHRDLKPANLFLTRLGHLKILDFGLAKQVTETDDSSHARTAMRDLTASATTVGTVAYMSPEQARGEAIDARTDLFSFGAVLYELASGSRAFPGSTTAMIFDSILHKQPVAPRQVRPDLDPRLEPIIMKALEKDRELRYQSAADIRADLKRLKHDSGVAAVARPRTRALWFAAAVVVAIVAAIGVWRLRPSSVSESSKQTTIAVLPFANLGGSSDRDYLKLALPDELITILSHSRSLAVRPFAMTRKFTGDVDPQQTGRNLSVANVITGHFRDSGGRIAVTLEAIDVEKNDVLWRDSLDAPAADLIAMRNEISNRVRSGLLPLLTASAGPLEGSRPRNDEAYALFLRAAAMSNDPEPNKQAWTMLERVVQLDPSYAPAWAALGARAYYDEEYGEGGEAAFDRAEVAIARALSIDPDLMDAAKRKIIMGVEKGDLEDAYRQAKDLLHRRAENADAHFAMSYVLRYTGLLNESATECERARSLDPTNVGLRSCGITFLLLGNIPRAKQYIQLDAGSAWYRSLMVYVLLHEGDRDGALRIGESGPGNRVETNWWPVLRIALQHHPRKEIHEQAVPLSALMMNWRDSEPIYYTAEILGFAGENEEALRLLRRSVEKGYTAYPAMDTDPAFAQIRGTPQFQQIRLTAIASQQRFLQFRSQLPP